MAVNLNVFSEDKTKVLPEVVQRKVHLWRSCREAGVSDKRFVRSVTDKWLDMI